MSLLTQLFDIPPLCVENIKIHTQMSITITTTAPPPQHHLHNNNNNSNNTSTTTTTSPPKHHLHNNSNTTSTTPPPQQHHLHNNNNNNTTSTTPPHDVINGCGGFKTGGELSFSLYYSSCTFRKNMDQCEPLHLIHLEYRV